jgi:hypothetical protein
MNLEIPRSAARYSRRDLGRGNRCRPAEWEFRRQSNLDGWIDADKGTGMLRSRVGPDYFKTLRTPLLAGREFDAHDNAAGARVAIVNQSFARTAHEC